MDKWGCHSDKAPGREYPAWSIYQRCGFWASVEGGHAVDGDDTRRCGGCRYGPNRRCIRQEVGHG